MADADPRVCPHRITKVVLDQTPRLRLSPQLDHERRAALYDLLADNHFSLISGVPGPYHLRIGLESERLRFEVQDPNDRPLANFTVPCAELRRLIRDYFLICDSYFNAIKTLPRSRIEAIDMGRRGLHNEGAMLLRDQMAGIVEMDEDTARRLFTLICVLHIRG